MAKILVIDDSPGILFIMQKALQLKKHAVKTASTFESADAVHKISPDLIFLDISLGQANGKVISRELKSNKLTKHIPIVILTGYPNAEKIAEEAQADDHLSKPFGLVYLWEMVTKHTEKIKGC